MKEVKNVNAGKEIAMSNTLVAGKYSLTKEEQNLIFLVASMVKREDKEFHRYKISLSDLEKATGVKHNRVRLKQLMHSIMSKPVWLNKEQTKIANWFAYIEADPKSSALICEFHWSLMPHMIQLQEYFTKAERQLLFSFKSKYSSRLYLLLKSKLGEQAGYANIVDCVLYVDDMINDFDLPKSYSNRYSNFKNKFLLPALEEINQLSDIFVTYDDKDHHRKHGRKITNIKFTVSKVAETEEEFKQKLLDTKNKEDYIPIEASERLREVVLSDELDLDLYYVRSIFRHHHLHDIERVCDDTWRNWDNKKIKDRKRVFIANIKKLEKKPEENHKLPFGFEEV
ncbi:initiator Replication family protein (plasmid) [Francisella tularensis subsp. novicida F6168]|uniref:RepA n=2 Tax=Francisella tularensis TaxID=263 RepID=O68836_FRATU|nr:replication initiation protein [Francisella tularensis]AAT44336.1 RepA protein [Shuttle vector pFNLTP1]ADI49666.1 RepA [Shuttle vector pXB173-lux]AAC12936.1 RepA [Francisella tularensis]AAD17305.1 RepA protein [Francisella tularensis subsp. novicida F6168]AJI44533.1 initiator Replication family protein [Francisella tularensis subsp. novicida F6168]